MANKCKYYKQRELVSYDGGTTWLETGNYRQGDLIEYESTDCPDVTGATLLTASYSNGAVLNVECNSSSAITSADTKQVGYDISTMTSAQLGECVTSIADMAFAQATSLTSVTFGSNVSTIGDSAFYWCLSLRNLVINASSFGQSAFQDCKALTSVTLNNTITSISESAFQGCIALRSIIIPNSVTTIEGWAFAACSSMTSVSISSAVTSIGQSAFQGCMSLSNVTIPDSVQTIADGAFQNCRSLTSVTIGSGVTSIGRQAFYEAGLNSITINATTPPTLGISPFGFTNDCPIYVPCESVDAYKAAWTSLAYRIQGIPPCASDVYVFNSDGQSAVTVNTDASAGYIVVNITSTKNGSIQGYSTSNPCGWLLPELLQQGKLHIRKQDNTDTDARTCVITLTQNESNQEIVLTIVQDYVHPSFSGKIYLNYLNGTAWSAECQSATAITTADTSAMTAITGDEGAISAITNATVGGCIQVVGDDAFENATSLTSVTLMNGVQQINSYAFAGCSSLTSIEFPISLLTIKAMAFMGSALEELNVPDSVTTIQSSAFQDCDELTAVTIGSGCTSIGSQAFYECTALTSVTVEATTPPTMTSDWVFDDTNDCPIYVPSESVNAYKNANRWSVYASRIQPIS